MAIPNATLNTRTVEGFKGMPTQPITPAVITSGTRFGINEHNNIRKERNRYSMHKAISMKAQNILSFSPLMMKLLPSRKVTLVPVKVTLYFDESKIWLAL